MPQTEIGWTDRSVNPVVGCNRVSKGCDKCYAITMARRLEAMGQKKYFGLTKKTKHGTDWTGKITFYIDAMQEVAKTKKPTMFFIPSMGDLFHKDVPFEFINDVMKIMEDNPQHIYQITTKRPDRALQFTQESNWTFEVDNIWIGTSIEDQPTANKRIPEILRIPANVRWLSIEPYLSRINLENIRPENEELLYVNALTGDWVDFKSTEKEPIKFGKISWVVVGCESGPKKRLIGLEAIRSIKKQCEEYEVPLFVKQMVINGKVVREVEQFPEDLRNREYPKELKI